MSSRSLFAASILLSGSLALSACVFMPAERHYVEEAVPPAGPDPSAPRMAALEAKHFTDLAADSEVLGDLQVLFARYENTLVRIARKHDLGLDELQFANPGVDIWLPGEATPIYLPTMSILPDAPRDGIVLNLPAMRLLYFTSGEAGRLSVTSHPVGIGREGWATPTGTTEVSDKVREPTWYPPASVRAEHAALGDPLPSIVPPGPDNPLGHFALDLSLPGYLIHGTNKPAGVGFAFNVAWITLCYKELKVCSFDPELAASMGIPVALFHYALMAATSMTTVTAFESVGAILVVALIVGPAATAYLLTHRLNRMLLMAVGSGFVAAVLGYALAALLDASIAGSMSVVIGALFTLALLFSPDQGIVPRAWRQRSLSREVAAGGAVPGPVPPRP
jgi:lipoprotein-anchoring transpeptidase ErfK/SrfK